MRKTLALIAFFAIATTGCPEESKQQTPPPQAPASAPAAKQTPPPAQPASAAAAGDTGAGQRLYLTACANCHGPDGTGSMMRQVLPKIGNLTSPEMHGRMSDEDIKTLIKTGRDKMPAFGTMFNDEQLQSLVAYVRSMKKPQ